MAFVEPIKIEGMREFQAALKSMDGESQKMLRVVGNKAAELVTDAVRPRIPSRTGAARSSLKVASGQRTAAVKAGGSKAPYYPWLDYGGKVGRGRTGPRTGSVNRPFLPGGRYLYPGYTAVRPKVITAMETGLADLAKSAGLEMT